MTKESIGAGRCNLTGDRAGLVTKV